MENLRDKKKLMNKNEIIKVSERLIFDKGYTSTTIDEIAKESGVTKRTLYSYFKSKEEIYLEIIDRGTEILNNMFIEVVKEECESEITRIKKMGKSLLQFEKNHRGYYKAIFEHDSLIVNCDGIDENTINILQTTIAKGVEKGEIINTIDIVDLSLILWSSIIGFVNTFSRKEEYIRSNFQKDIEHVTDIGFDLILKSIKM
ncbi:MAG: TetR/AcrR family transcriptional regulator [Clostridium sp.]